MSFIAGCFRKTVQWPNRTEPRGFKVTDAARSRKFGVACRSLQELKRKACVKFNVTNDPAEVNVLLPDGSRVDEEYFRTLEPQTTLILQRPGDEVLSDADLLYETLRRVNMDFLLAGDKIAKFLSENLGDKIAKLHVAFNRDDSRTGVSTRDGHPEWFEGLESHVTTKEAYMHRRCQDRIRGFLYKTIEQIKSSEAYSTDRRTRRHLLQVIAFFKAQLKADHYFGYYFDRSCADGVSKDEADATDRSGRINCYDHCPCKLKFLNDPYCSSFVAEADVTDARKLKSSPKKRPAEDSTDDEQEILCPYQVVPGASGKQIALCDGKGEFRCHGLWNADECTYGVDHRINPYRSREELILFSTWNLDHKIERSRTLLPDLLKASEETSVSGKDVIGFYENLFTVKNLRLVHIVCHDKSSHK